MLSYRKEIDGLRAVAVLAVILFHAGFSSLSGGFVGVDVFFVISGYLITSIIVIEKQSGNFSLIRFYERRARRILPALFVLMLVCVPIALFSLPPGDFADFCQSLVATTLFSSNILFYLKSGYFESAGEPPPLLHTWSLAVEEQFYLLFPILLSIVWKFGARVLAGIMAGVGITSLAAAQWGSGIDASATFFFLPTRVWELLIGSLTALNSFQKGSSYASGALTQEVLGLAGMLLIVSGIFVFDNRTPFPSVYALVPTIGTALVILFATGQTTVAKMLSNRVMVWLGVLSYSAYLWHQPIFAFLKHRSLEEPSFILRMALVVLVFLCAYLSWRWVENPFRNRQCISSEKVIMSGTLCGCVLILVGLIGHLNNGFINGLTPKQMRVLYAPGKEARLLYREGVCYLTPEQNYSAFVDECRARRIDHSILLWGDSHAAALSVGLRKTLTDIGQFTASGCPPVKDIAIPWRKNCQQINDYVLREIERVKPATIFLHASWTFYREQDLVRKLIDTIVYIHDVNPVAQVIIVGAVPQWKRSLPKVMLLNGIVEERETYLETPLWQDLSEMDKELMFVGEEAKAEFVSAIRNLCVSDKCKAITMTQRGPTLTAWDYGHLTEGGAVLLAKKILESLPAQILRGG